MDVCCLCCGTAPSVRAAWVWQWHSVELFLCYRHGHLLRVPLEGLGLVEDAARGPLVIVSACANSARLILAALRHELFRSSVGEPPWPRGQRRPSFWTQCVLKASACCHGCRHAFVRYLRGQLLKKETTLPSTHSGKGLAALNMEDCAKLVSCEPRRHTAEPKTMAHGRALHVSAQFLGWCPRFSHRSHTPKPRRGRSFPRSLVRSALLLFSASLGHDYIKADASLQMVGNRYLTRSC